MKRRIFFSSRFFPYALLLFAALDAGTTLGQRNGDPMRENTNIVCAGYTVTNNVLAPDFKVIKPMEGRFKIGVTLEWDADQGLRNKYAATFQSVENVALASGDPKAPPLRVSASIVKSKVLDDMHPDLPEAFRQSKDAYLLQISDHWVRVYATHEGGIVNGLGSLESLLFQFEGVLLHAKVADWPDLNVRSVQLAMRGATTGAVKSAIDRMRRMHFNSVLLELGNNVRFPQLGKLANNCAWSVDEFLEVVQYARQSGMDVIPAVRLLTHQHKEFFVTGAYPELMYNAKTYNPQKKQVYDIVLPYLDAIIDMVNPAAIHIGHDEVFGVSGKHKGAKDALPAELFKQHVIKIHGYLKSKNVRTWLSGDMLISPSEFPEMHPGSLNGTKEYAAIRKDIPRDIVITDWHYRDESLSRGTSLKFPSMKMFAEEGFDVLGATYKHPHVTRAFPRYAASLKHPKVKGMICTTWFFFRKGALGESGSGSWKDFDDVLQLSAESIWNANSIVY